MTGDHNLASRIELLRQAYLKIEKLQDRLRVAEKDRFEPIAVIGIGCRFPGDANDPQSFWKLLEGGVDAVGEIPSDRWDVEAYYSPNPEAEGKMYTRNGAFLSQIDGFDAQFFGISPREAIKMDPQQRVLLEVVWEAFEHAGQSPEHLAGSSTGVFIGMNADDYAHLYSRWAGLESADLYYGSGVARSIAAGRISYALGLRGPSLSIDTACSSSLVAVHLACQSLRDGECRMAVAGGVTLILAPDGHVIASKGQMLSRDGRCKTFDAAADGYGRGEGAGMVVLKRLSDAKAEGDNILGLIRGSAINQDGKSAGLTAPNSIAQEEVLRKALQNAQVAAADVGYIETHGTGTMLGDPIEIQALGAVYGAGHSRNNPLLVGSVKTNVGHLEAAAGITGLIKVLLSFRHAEIPPHLHFKTPNPYIPWDSLPIEVVTRRRPWPEYECGPIAGLSSFGFSGTNVHIILQGSPSEERTGIDDARTSNVLALSAKTPGALEALAGKYVDYLDQRLSEPIANICFTANTGRSHFNSRLAVIGKTAEELREGLHSFRDERPNPRVFHRATAFNNTPKPVFLFSGQGTQSIGMGRALYDTQPVFRKALERCQDILRGHLGKPLLDILYPVTGSELEAQTLMSQTGFTQPLLFAVEYALAELWKSWGIEPSGVMGHSVGEYVAACIAEVFSLEDGLRLIAERGKLMQALPPGGAMASVFADADFVATALCVVTSKVCIAAINSPQYTVIAGPEADVTAVLKWIKEKGIGFHQLLASHAFHSPLVEPMISDFKKVADTIQYAEPRIDFVSNLSGQIAGTDNALDAAYWCRHVREPVQFMASMQTLYKLGYRLFVEVGPHPSLLEMGAQCLQNPDCVWVPSLRRGYDDREQTVKALATLYANGVNVNWRGFEQEANRHRLPLPTYPFQRERHWFEAVKKEVQPEPVLHPLLGRQVAFAKSTDIVFESDIKTDQLPFLLDHRFYGSSVVPATAYLEVGQAVATAIAGSGFHSVEDFNIHAPLIIEERARLTLQTVVEVTGENEARFEIYSRDDNNAEVSNLWKLHASGKLDLNKDQAENVDAKNWQLFQKLATERCAESLTSLKYYEMLRLEGVDYGPAFQCLEDIQRGFGEAISRIHIPACIAAESRSYHVHPAILDSGLQLLGVALLGEKAQQGGHAVYMPMGLERYSLDQNMLQDGWIHGAIRSESPTNQETFIGDVEVLNGAGGLIAELKGLLFKRVSKNALRRTRPEDFKHWLHELKWQFLGNPTSIFPVLPPLGKWLIVCDHQGVGQGLAACLQKMEQECILVENDAAYLDRSKADFMLDSDPRDAFECLLRDICSGGRMALEGIVYLSGLDIEAPVPAVPIWEEHPELDCIGVLNLVKAMSGIPWEKPPQMILVTCGAAVVGEQVNAKHIQPQQATLWGLGRVITAEHPEFRCKLVDLDPSADTEDKIQSLVEEVVQHRCCEDQLALRQGQRFALRLVRSQDKSKVHPTSADILSECYQLEISSRGVIDNLEFRPFTPLPPGTGEVQIKIEATGLNFRDVLNALGMYPGDPGALGNECVGRITLLGPGVQGFEIGEPVLALAPRAFCSHVNVAAELIASRPDKMSVEDAATIPMTFLTAMYALHYLGHMQPGERVLIHAGAGGVGMAAIQLARQAGAEIFATAGSEEKRTLLKSLGVEHVMDSRTLDFSDQIIEETANEGIDIVLNSLASEFIPKSLSLLRAGGRFLELGKTDLWDQDRAAQVNPAATFIPVFLGDICQRQPSMVQSMFRDIMQGLRDGLLKPLPHRSFPIQEVKTAFRYMAQAKHIGKVVLDQYNATPDHPIRDNATYLITGGFGALGLHFARWLAKQGARHLVLLGRRTGGQAAQEAIKELKASGISVAVALGDVSKKRDLQRVLEEMADMPPLKGIIHAAGLVDDGLLRNLNQERFIRVMAPKISGSWLLHILTQSIDLDLFVMFSAGAALFGSSGQGNYAAANAFMDALAYYRCSLGLPALSINWGPWSNGGMTKALRGRDRQKWISQGMGMIEPHQGVQALGQALNLGIPQVAVLPISWSIFFQKFAAGEEPPFLSEIAKSERSPVPVGPLDAQPDDSNDILERLFHANTEDRRNLLMEHVRDQAISVLGLRPSAKLSFDEGLTDLGMDSLMAVELSNRLKRTLGCFLPSTLAFEYPNIRVLADYLSQDVLKLAMGDSKNESAQVSNDPQKSIGIKVAELSESEAEQRLLQELDRTGY